MTRLKARNKMNAFESEKTRITFKTEK